MKKFIKASRLYWHFSAKAKAAKTVELHMYYVELTQRAMALEFKNALSY